MTSSENMGYVMSSAVLQGEQIPLVAEFRQGTQVLLRWAQWHKQHAFPMAIQIGVFRKGAVRLMVYQYGRTLCVAVKMADVAPKIRDFREWREPFATVKGKLIQRGWAKEEEREEVSHAH